MQHDRCWCPDPRLRSSATVTVTDQAAGPSTLVGVERLPCSHFVAALGSKTVNQAGVSLQLLCRMRTGWLAVAAAMGLCCPGSPLVAQQPDSTKAFADSVAVRQEVIAAGRKVFQGKGTCFACHGAKLEGTAIAPTLRNPKWRNGDGSLGMILRVLHNGVPKTTMVRRPGNIDETELLQVATYVWAVSRGAVKP